MLFSGASTAKPKKDEKKDKKSDRGEFFEKFLSQKKKKNPRKMA